MSEKTKYNIISITTNAILGIICFFSGFYLIITASLSTEAYKLIITTIIVILACIVIPFLFNKLLSCFFQKKLDKKYLRRGYIYFIFSFLIAFAILMAYTFYVIAHSNQLMIE